MDLLCSDNLSFWCTAPSTWLTNYANPNTRLQSPTREGCWLQNSSIHHTMKIEKLLSYKSLQCTNTATSSQESWTRANPVFGHNLFEQTFLNTCATCVTFNSPKIILLDIKGCEKRKPKYTITDWMKNSFEKLNFINLDKYLSVKLLSSHRLEQLYRSR